MPCKGIPPQDIRRVAEKDNNTDVQKYNLLLFFFFCYMKRMYGKNKRDSEMAKECMRTHIQGQVGDSAFFSVKPLYLSASFCLRQNLPWFLDAHIILRVTVPTNMLHMDMPPI